jgi:hypothetical protein
MSFMRGLQRVESLLTFVADYIGANGGHQQPHQGVTAPHIQNPALRSFPRGGHETNGGEIDERDDNGINTDVHCLSSIPLPPKSSSERDFVRYYESILDSLKTAVFETVQPSIPNETKEQLFLLLRQEMNARRMLDEAEQNQFENMQAILAQVEGDLSSFSSQVLDLVDIHLEATESTNGVKEWQLPLLQSAILSSASRQLASYASRGHAEAMRIHILLHDLSLMKSILSSNGPKGGNYGSMLSIYYDILDASERAKIGSASNDIFHRLAQAVALEHASPIKVFDTNEIIDPIARYMHYEEAYLQGELDPSFHVLSAWELRMVVNNDASNNEIEWCRDMLRNYRPDHILERNDQWKYCMIVKSDVRYRCPEWAANTPRTYTQMISGGGKCGPRAWFGRFACKSFGIPTWGVRQPGHAAMSHWTPHEWVICLGGPNWKKSFWEDCNGVEFEIETRARTCHDSYEKVLWLDCLAAINQEGCIGSQNRQYLSRHVDQRLWRELSLLQKKAIATSESQDTSLRRRDDDLVETLVESMLRHQNASSESIIIEPEGRMTIPAGISLTPKSGNVIYTKSFYNANSGKQAHLRDDGSLEFQIRLKRDQTYRLIARVVTVHANPTPLKLCINSVYSKTEYEIDIPYSKGYWDETRHIEVNLPAGMNRLRFYREEGLGLTIKEFILEPIAMG